MNQTTPLIPPTSRRFMPWMLRSLLIVFMSGILLIAVTGRKSRRAISMPVNDARDGDTLLVTSQADRTWWKNVRGGAKVTLRISGKTYETDATVLEDRAIVERDQLRFFRLSSAPSLEFTRTKTADPPSWISLRGWRNPES